MEKIEKTEIEGTVSIRTDHGITPDVEWVMYRGRAWLAPLWIISNDGQWILPVRLIAPKWGQADTSAAGVEALLIFQELPVPRVLLDFVEARPVDAALFDVLELPQVVVQNPAASH